jgi:carbonic anhydrase
LIEGNKRYATDALLHADHSSERREELTQGQKPFATIVSCSDSRVPPEVIFDQGMGDLFIVRIAGNVVGPVELDSIEYSVKYLGSSLILVTGHEACGAVQATLAKKTEDIENVAALIEPSIRSAKTLDQAIVDNARGTSAQLKRTPLIQKMIKEKKLECRAAYYHIGSGKVDILD